jgi:lipoate-protein ligase B
MVEWSFRGRMAYRDALAEQLAIRERVWAGGDGEVILCEHPPVITLGRSADRANVLAAGDIPVEQIERGGDVTYHGPGQLMIYPVVRIRSVVAFLESIAHAIAEVARERGVEGVEWRRDPAGAWLGDAKLAACGIHVARGVSVHGFAFDVATPPEAWRGINPCGLGRPTISLSRACGRAIAVEDVARSIGPKLIGCVAHA